MSSSAAGSGEILRSRSTLLTGETHPLCFAEDRMTGLVALARALAAGAETDSARARVMVRNKSWAR